jgi:hypothetical protein
MSTDQMSGAGAGLAVLPPGLVPTPTPEYQAFRVEQGLATGVLQRRPLVLQPQPSSAEAVPTGTRVLIWKQDPGVGEIGIRKAFLPDQVLPGPRDTRIVITGLPPVSSNALGDFIVSPADAEAFDSVHTFAIVRQTLTMYQRNRGGAPLPWQWNGPTNTDPISVFPHAGVTANAFYDRNAKALKFFFFTKPGDPPTAPQIFTCRSLDIVAHETGHAVLDGLKPGWLGMGNPPQTGGLHESFGDLSAIFLALSQLDQVEAVVAQTKANLHDKSFLADLAEQFGAALGRPNGLRNADNDLKLSEVGNEVHALSQVFTGAIYDVLADIFAHERRVALKDDAAVLYQVGQYLAGLVVRAIIQSPPQGATFADVANRMRALVVVDKHPAYKAFITQQFTRREVLLAAEDGGDDTTLLAAVVDEPDAEQDRRGCCGTMLLAQEGEDEAALDSQYRQLAEAFGSVEAERSGEADIGELPAELR